MATTRGYTASKQQLLNRLARIEGQVRGISSMVDDDRYCIDVLTQVGAVQAALDRVSLGLLDGHVRHCMGANGGGDAVSADGEASANGAGHEAHADGPPVDPEEQISELMGAVGRLVHR